MGEKFSSFKNEPVDDGTHRSNKALPTLLLMIGLNIRSNGFSCCQIARSPWVDILIQTIGGQKLSALKIVLNRGSSLTQPLADLPSYVHFPTFLSLSHALLEAKAVSNWREIVSRFRFDNLTVLHVKQDDDGEGELDDPQEEEWNASMHLHLPALTTLEFKGSPQHIKVPTWWSWSRSD